MRQNQRFRWFVKRLSICAFMTCALLQLTGAADTSGWKNVSHEKDITVLQKPARILDNITRLTPGCRPEELLRIHAEEAISLRAAATRSIGRPEHAGAPPDDYEGEAIKRLAERLYHRSHLRTNRHVRCINDYRVGRRANRPSGGLDYNNGPRPNLAGGAPFSTNCTIKNFVEAGVESHT